MAQKMIILWSPQAMDLIAELHEYLTEQLGENKADNYIQELFDFTENKLASHPERISPCINPYLREVGCRCLLFKKKNISLFLMLQKTTKFMYWESSIIEEIPVSLKN